MSTKTSEVVAATTNPNQLSNMVHEIEKKFVDMLQQFLQALVDVFPECEGVKKYSELFREKYLQVSAAEKKIVSVVLVRRYHQYAASSYDLCLQRDPRVFLIDNEVLQTLKLSEKFHNAHEETQKSIWSYVTHLNENAQLHNLYSKIPGGMLSSLESLAANLSSTIQSPTDLQNIDFQQLGQQVMQNINTADMEDFSKNLQSGGVGELSQMFGMLQNMLATPPK